jgi:membrane-bound lytic murein transglycosylase B
MPSQIFINGVDADGDGKIDLFTRADAVHSIANYLKNSGWKAKMSKKQQIKVIYAYNHSSVYANTVLIVAQQLSGKGLAKRKQSAKRA